ncbi:MAG: radical SAM protein, partial [Candidatus Thorarchaeota archaeon]
MIDFDVIREEVESWDCSKVKEVQRSLLSGPPLIDIEVSSICNLECSFCPRNEIVRDNNLMDMNMLKVLSEWLPDNAIVMFSGLGECLLNENLERMIHLLKERKISSCIVTNGILLDPDRQQSLIEAGVDQIQISYVAFNEETYQRAIGKKGNYDRLIKNLQHLSDHKPEDLRVQLNFVDLGYNSNEIASIQEITDAWGFDFFYRRLHSRGGSISESEIISEDSTCFRCGTFVSVYFITSDGKIISCSNDVEQRNVIGNFSSISYND